MFIGHFAVALGAKKVAPKVSLGTLFLSATFIDLLWPLFLLIGIEHVRIDPGNTAVTPLDFYDYPISHSLLAVLGWSMGFGLVYYFLRRKKRDAVVLGLGVLSHWILDLLTHRPDLPLLPWDMTRVGFGLWNSLPMTVIIEGGLFCLGLYLYLGTTSAKDRVGTWSLWAWVIFIASVYGINLLGPPPPSEQAIAFGGLAAWLFIPWAFWIDRHRQPRTSVHV